MSKEKLDKALTILSLLLKKYTYSLSNEEKEESSILSLNFDEKAVVLL